MTAFFNLKKQVVYCEKNLINYDEMFYYLGWKKIVTYKKT